MFLSEIFYPTHIYMCASIFADIKLFYDQVVEIERARALRLAKEQADEALEAAQRSSLLLRKHELHTSTEQAALLTETSVRQAESKLLETVGLIQEESTKLLEAERVHTLRQNKARMAARQAQLRQEYAERSGAQLQSVLSAQGELQAQVLRLQQAALRSEMDRDLAYSTNTAASSGQFEETKVSFFVCFLYLCLCCIVCARQSVNK